MAVVAQNREHGREVMLNDPRKQGLALEGEIHPMPLAIEVRVVQAEELGLLLPAARTAVASVGGEDAVLELLAGLGHSTPPGNGRTALGVGAEEPPGRRTFSLGQSDVLPRPCFSCSGSRIPRRGEFVKCFFRPKTP